MNGPLTHLCFRLVDDVASHVRLFKKSRLALATRNKDDGKIVDLVRTLDILDPVKNLEPCSQSNLSKFLDFYVT